MRRRALLFVGVLALAAAAVPAPALALVSQHESIDDRDPLALPFPTTLAEHDVYVGWQNELHWDTSNITISNTSRRSRSPSDGNNAFTLGYRLYDDFSFYVQSLLAFRNQAVQAHAQLDLVGAGSDFPVDVAIGGGLGYSSKGGLLPEGQLVFGRTFKSSARVTFAPQLVLGLRILGQAFAEAAVNGDPNSAYAGITQRRLVFDTLIFLEASWKGFTARFGTGWENLVQTFYTHEDTPGANFSIQNGPLLMITLGASFSTEKL